jgi:hypothetical protein
MRFRTGRRQGTSRKQRLPERRKNMPLVKCPRTGKLFNNDNGPVHPDAMEEEMQDYDAVLNFLAEFPRSSPEAISEATGVALDCIHRMIAQDRIESVDLEKIEKREKDLLEEQQRRNKRQTQLLKELQKVKLPKKKDVEFGGTVRSALEQKRNKGSL